MTFADHSQERPEVLDLHHVADARTASIREEDVLDVLPDRRQPGVMDDELRVLFCIGVLPCLQSGPSSGFPWTCYILAAAPNLAAIRGVGTAS
jgi:hypothetical protein